MLLSSSLYRCCGWWDFFQCEKLHIWNAIFNFKWWHWFSVRTKAVWLLWVRHYIITTQKIMSILPVLNVSLIFNLQCLLFLLHSNSNFFFIRSIEIVICHFIGRFDNNLYAHHMKNRCVMWFWNIHLESKSLIWFSIQISAFGQEFTVFYRFKCLLIDISWENNQTTQLLSFVVFVLSLIVICSTHNMNNLSNNCHCKCEHRFVIYFYLCPSKVSLHHLKPPKKKKLMTKP